MRAHNLALCILAATAACVSPAPDRIDGGSSPGGVETPVAAPQGPGPLQTMVPSPSGKTWDFVVQPYLMFTNIDGNAGVGRVGDVPVDVDFGDILEALELGGMLHAEAHHDSGFGAMLDYGFMELGAKRSGFAGAVLDVDVRQGVFEGFVTHRSHFLNGATVDLFAGVRWWDVDLETTLAPSPLRRDRRVDWIDPVVGVRAQAPFRDDWSLITRWDMGGFGVASDFSWTASLGVRYRTSDRFAVELHYRALAVDYDEANGTPDFFRYDTITHGPLLGFSIFF